MNVNLTRVKKLYFWSELLNIYTKEEEETHYMIVLLNDWFAIIPSKALSIKDY